MELIELSRQLASTYQGMQDELSSGNEAGFAALQEQTGMIEERLQVLRMDEVIKGWLIPLHDDFSDINGLRPRRLSTEDSLGQLNMFEKQSLFIADLYEDLLTDFEAIRPYAGGALPRIGDEVAAASGPLHFESFRKDAIHTVRRSNAHFADLLEQRAFPFSDRYQYRPYWQAPPFVQLRQSDGEWFRLSELTTMHRKALDAIKDFIDEHDYDELQDAICFPAPGNWIYLIYLAGNFPRANLMVVDPWPDLFQEMIELSAFYSCMPRDICLVIAHDAMPNLSEEI